MRLIESFLGLCANIHFGSKQNAHSFAQTEYLLEFAPGTSRSSLWVSKRVVEYYIALCSPFQSCLLACVLVLASTQLILCSESHKNMQSIRTIK